MLIDIYWGKNDNCDFMDIRIPPKENYRILVPINAYFNVYFSKTPENDDDEMFKINTGELSKIILNPGITLSSKSN